MISKQLDFKLAKFKLLDFKLAKFKLLDFKLAKFKQLDFKWLENDIYIIMLFKMF